ncbi:ribonuclease [Novosphingobium fluoreni]|uniref:ribonuclease n=1 Tax=Novosphingobium fluoreni TaxID=1391222 RepID=UPI003DA0EC9F
MPEWLVEQGIGEDRAILVEHGEVRAARLQRPGKLTAGLIEDARLIARAAGSRRGTALFASGEEAVVDGLAKDAQEGALIRLQVTRAAMAEKGRYKRAQARPATATPRPAPSLSDKLRAGGNAVRVVRRFTADPWPEIIGEAADGLASFSSGSLTVSPTPAMTLIDVDGTLPPPQLAMAAIPALAATIRRLDLAGSIGIDFPSLDSKDDRRRLDDALAGALAQWPHQRTAINGFGFVQLVARLERPSILATVQQDPVTAAALLLLRRVEDVSAPGAILALANAPVIAAVTPSWREEAARRTGRAITWQAQPGLALLGGFAQAISS